ncbi:MAG: hypothetical protein KBT36_01415 [Kurthia sp.]|nr:hypothetical protein [Candidatus Kurthia equi]
MKKTNFLALLLEAGKQYNVPYQMFVKVIQEAKPKAINQENKTLNKGELFYIEDGKRKDALLFAYDSIEKGYIIGTSPVSITRTRINPALYVGRVQSLMDASS